MKHGNQRLRRAPRPLWKRILERYKFRGSLLRPRVPLVLFRIWSPNTNRQAQRGSGPTVAHYPLTLNFNAFWQQPINKETRRQTLIERSIFSRAVTRELLQAWLDPDRTNGSARLPDLIARPSAKVRGSAETISVARHAQARAASALPLERTVTLPPGVSSQPPALHDELSHLGPRRKTIGPKTFRRFSEKVFKSGVHTLVAERNVLVTSSARSGELAYRPKSNSAGGASSSPLEDDAAFQPATLPRSRISRSLQRNVDMTPRLSVSVQSQFIQPERAVWAGQNSLPGVRSRLFAQSASLNLASPPAAGSAARSEPQEQTSISRLPAVVQPAQPQLDIGRLSDEVYRHIQKKIRVERERRGM
jgi:hypothetical protein